MKKFTLDPNNPPTLTKAEEEALDKTEHFPDEDSPELDASFFTKAVRYNQFITKKRVTVRLDEDVLDWLKREGSGYQTRLNRILRSVMESDMGQKS